MGYATAVNSTMYVFWWVLLIGLICGVLLFIFYWVFTFNITVRLRYKTNSYDKVRDTKGKYIEDKDGVEKLIVRLGIFKRKNLPMPPDKGISLSSKGKDNVEVEVSTNGAWRYMIRETSDPKFKPYDTNDRVFHINEHDKRLERKSKKTLMQVVADAVPFIALIVILALVIFGWGEVVAPFEKIGNQQAGLLKEVKAIAQIQKETLREEQIVRGNEAPIKKVVNQPPPLDNPLPADTAPPAE